MSHSKLAVSCSVAAIVALLFVPFGVVSADFINFANPTATGAEDTAIPLGITVDPALLEGGSQLDIIGSAAGFRDATAGVTPNTFAIPTGAAFVRITGMGGLDNASSSNAKDEEFQLTTITVDLAAQTYSGHTAYVVDQYNGNGNYVFTDVALGAASDSGDIVGHNLFSANSIIVSATDSSLSISESQSRLDQAYLVEFLANEASSSNYLGAVGKTLATGTVSDTLTLPIGTSFTTLSMMLGSPNGANSQDEEKGLGQFVIDIDTMLASGVVYAETASGDAYVSGYAFTDYDLSSDLPILSSTASVIGDTTANSNSLPNPILTLAGDVLTITRTSGTASTYTGLFTALNYARESVGSAARNVGSSAVSGTYHAYDGTLDTFDIALPSAAETGSASLVTYNVAGSNSTNENGGSAMFLIDVVNQTTTGSFVLMRSATPEIVFWKELPFGTRVIDHENTVWNRSTLSSAADQFPVLMQFDKATADDGSPVLRISSQTEGWTNASPASHFQYDVVISAQWAGRAQVEFAGTAANGVLSAGALDTESGLWLVEPADIEALTYTPDLHYSGTGSSFAINYADEASTLAINVTGVADVPTITTQDQSGTQRLAIDLSTAVPVALVDQDGSETISSLELSLSEGHTVNSGSNTFTAVGAQSTVDVADWNLSALSYVSNDVGVFPVNVRITVEDDDGFSLNKDTTESLDSFNVTLIVDTDEDGIADIVDLDDDNDGLSDIFEGDGDVDGDGIPNSIDSSDQGAYDFDGDGQANSAESCSVSDVYLMDVSIGGQEPSAILTDGVYQSDIELRREGGEVGQSSTVGASTFSLGESSDYIGLHTLEFTRPVFDVDILFDNYVEANSFGNFTVELADGTVFINADFTIYEDTVSTSSSAGIFAPWTSTRLGIKDSSSGTHRIVAPANATGNNQYGARIRLAETTTGDYANGIKSISFQKYDGFTSNYVGKLSVSARFMSGPDADGDSIVDCLDTDADNDGIPDSVEGVGDADGDGIPNHLDTDSDNDGITDGTEAGVTGNDADNDGIDDLFDVDVTGGTDSDGDGVDDSVIGNDTDGDGIPDAAEQDTDGDGIPDNVEGTGDADGDGIPNNLDTDSDNDGILDGVESGVTGNDTDADGIDDLFDVDVTGGTDSDGDGVDDAVIGNDTDGDGIPDASEQDTDGDGVPDNVEGTSDSDGDGIADYLDTDSDNDGIDDGAEVGVSGNDADNDGIDDLFDVDVTGGVDSDGDGVDDLVTGNDTDGDGIPDSADQDTDGDGIPDNVEGAGDSDGDGIPDNLDTDSDNDGISDGEEVGVSGVDTDGDGIDDLFDIDTTGGVDNDGDGVDDAVFGTDTDADGILDSADQDTDGDGVPDIVEGMGDADGDGIPDSLDTDSDNDGISDGVEAGITGNDTDGDGIDDLFDVDATNGVDTNGDGVDDAVIGTDTDGDGTPDSSDQDTDGDGVPDNVEGAGDSDGDGIPDNLDTDSDNDGISDGVEAGITGNDVDGDGIDDLFDVDATGGADSDGDGVDDNVVGNDTDGDGIPDSSDQDTDGDGVPDNVEGAGDLDQDGIPNNLDTDSDNDGISDGVEAGVSGNDADADGIDDLFDVDATGGTDADGDGVDDSVIGTDTDGDGIPDSADQDTDGDGVPDSVEGSADTDNDGIPDNLDTDSDGDGIADSAEGIVDTDADGIADYLDTDSDNDGISDVIEGVVDTDDDGVLDYLDTDSDGDGISDTIESSIDTDGDGASDYVDTDSDGDGIADVLEGAGDTDDDGISDALDTDSDNDGIPDSEEGINDSDGDGVPNAQDTDANGDGIPDSQLGSGDTDNDGVPDYLDGDIDGDGIANGSEGELIPAEDTDGDGIPNYLDLDSDNDGIMDIVEGSGDSDGDGIPDSLDSDGNNDGIPDVEAGSGDTDGDGIPDYLDNDIDGDGVSNADESIPDASADSDGDGIPDYRDTDSDNDGIPDGEEGVGDNDGDGIPDFADTDTDGDGIPDFYEGNDDNDGDGNPNYLDLDSDNDGIPDELEVNNSDQNVSRLTDDFIFQDDTDAANFEGATDRDNDGLVDFLDLDSDNDSIPDLVEAGGSDADGNGRIDDYLDSNGDGLDDGIEALPLELTDTDGDGLVDYLDLDADNDGVPDIRESANASLDTNGDGVIDSIVDDNGDGWPDNATGIVLLDTDGDGVPNHQDLDSDSDGVSDLSEAGGTDANADGVIDGWVDVDNDGVPDDIDADQLPASDADGDGIADFADADFSSEQDTDGDGIVDRFDIDPFADGFARLSTGEPVIGTTLPDTDGDGTPDLLQISAAVAVPEGVIRTGLSGSGSVGPLSLVLLGVPGLLLARRRQQHINVRSIRTPSEQTTSVPLVELNNTMIKSPRPHRAVVGVTLLSALIASGCSSLGSTDTSRVGERDLERSSTIVPKAASATDPVLSQALPINQPRVGKHVYLAAGIGASHLNPDTSEVTTFGVNDRVNAGGQITLGMDVSRQLAVELHSVDLGSAGLTPTGRINYHQYGASALVYAGKNRHQYKRQGLTGYGRIGVGVLENSAVGNVPFEQENSTHFLIGAGVEYMTKVGLGLRAEVISYDEDIKYAQFALVYRMGEKTASSIVKRVPVYDQVVQVEPLMAAAIDPIDCDASIHGPISVYFATDSAELDATAKQALSEIGENLLMCKTATVTLEGHTDSVGSQQHNKALSQRRVASVRNMLSTMSVDNVQMTANGYGEEQPVASNLTDAGRRLNRRVSIGFD